MVNEGLFNTYFDGIDSSIDGRQLYLGVQVEDDTEMTPRQYIDTVPIAWTLRPGAIISDTRPGNSNLHIENWGAAAEDCDRLRWMKAVQIMVSWAPLVHQLATADTFLTMVGVSLSMHLRMQPVVWESWLNGCIQVKTWY